MWLDPQNILEVDNLGKLYSKEKQSHRRRLGKNILRSLFGRSLLPVSELQSDEFWAFRDINFSLKRGEALGVVGLNGAGKTTLLRVLAGQLLPDRGEIRMSGEQAAMIDLTAGFQMGSTGRRNIFLRGAMLGLNKEQINENFEEIVTFSELGDAIDTPISSYSSGMLMRLAFSITIAIEPDLMLVDEILSVGDFRFRQKCLARIRELRSRAAFVLVSHSMNQIKAFCDRAIVLHKGRMVFDGEPDEAVRTYEEMKFPEVPTLEARRAEVLKPQFNNADLIRDVAHYWHNSSGDRVSEISFGETLYMRLQFTMAYTPKNLIVGVPLWNDEGTYVTGFSTDRDGSGISVSAHQSVEVTLTVPKVLLNPAIYISNIAIHDGLECIYRAANPVLSVRQDSRDKWGITAVEHQWTISSDKL